MAKVTVNKYDIIILDGIVDGKRHRLSTGKKVDKQLLQWYKRHVDDEFFKLYNEKYHISSNTHVTFSEYGKFILDITKSNRNEFSQKDVLYQFKVLCRTFGDVNLADIKASHILKWQNECGFAPKTVQNYRGTLSLILKMALYDEIITKNPANSTNKCNFRRVV